VLRERGVDAALLDQELERLDGEAEVGRGGREVAAVGAQAGFELVAGDADRGLLALGAGVLPGDRLILVVAAHAVHQAVLADAQLLAVWPKAAYERREREIAGARRLSYSDLFDETRGIMRPAQRLRELTADLDPHKRTITYCANGVHSSAAYFALRAAGFSDVAVYDGSWAEWKYHNLPTAMVHPEAKGP